MLQTVSRLSACSRIILASTRPAAAVRQAVTPITQNGLKSYLPSRLQSCLFNSRAAPSFGIASKSLPGLSLAPGPKMSPWTSVSQPSPLALNHPISTVQIRSVTKWSLQKGKRKTVKAVIHRFKRLEWGGRGIWIRARAGAKKKMWKKSPAQRKRCKTHVFCNATQSFMLDKMVTRYWKKVRHYPDDPYKPYMKRENFRLCQHYPREYY